ncbi:MAG: hypothetical protein A2289_24790 [Deltaproteobacteria bacterium RIFOXYA12_FULL_58_15]|nr:MAG: hypothetical protein A2289_24790 [Deltaproteobacteria bacterium RIFOXYA12_FULL_58_15]
MNAQEVVTGASSLPNMKLPVGDLKKGEKNKQLSKHLRTIKNRQQLHSTPIGGGIENKGSVSGGQPSDIFTKDGAHSGPVSDLSNTNNNAPTGVGVEALLGPLSARINALGDKVEATIEGSRAMKAARKRASNFGHKNFDPRAVKADAFFQRMIESAEKLEANQTSALETVARMLEERTPQRAVENLQKTAATIIQWATDAQNESTRESRIHGTSLKDVKRALIAAKIIGEVADHLSNSIANEDQEKAKQQGVDLALKIRRKGLNLVGRFTHTGRALKRGGLTFVARTTKKFFQSLRKTSVNVIMSFGAGNYLLNDRIYASMYFPSLEESTNNGSYTDSMYLDYGNALDSMVPYVAWGRRGRTAAGVNIGFFSAFYDDKQYGIWVGWPGVWGVSLGKDSERGAYTSFGTSLPVPLCPLLFFFPGTGVKVYSPFLNPLEKLGRPAAKFMVKLVGEATTQIKTLAHKIHEVRNEPAPEPNTSGIETMAAVGFGAT